VKSGLRLALLLGSCAVAAGSLAGPTLAQPEAAAYRPTVLTTGDSMIQIVDTFIERRLESRRRARVLRDSHISTGISKPFLLDWPRYAARQVRRSQPRATVIFIGANDGFDMRTSSGRKARCCGHAWIVEYARRARTMMATYARGGAGRVYWLLMPQAREGFFRGVYPAVNAALKRAAAPRGDHVRLVYLNRLFTPHGHYRDFMRWQGRLVRVRQADGIHLSATGASITASIVIRKMRADGVFRGPEPTGS
jgi:hypothetical protein